MMFLWLKFTGKRSSWIGYEGWETVNGESCCNGCFTNTLFFRDPKELFYRKLSSQHLV